MVRKIPSYLKIHVEPPAHEAAPVDVAPARDWERLCRSFQTATGWSMRFQRGDAACPNAAWSAPVELSDGTTVGHLLIESPLGDDQGHRSSAKSLVDLASVEPLAESLRTMLAEIEQVRQTLRQREAELAAGIPVVARPDEQEHLATRLEAVLRAGAESVGCRAAALYLLDDATSQLKLRASWGLPGERYHEQARPLRGAVADLEALVGHAVVLEDAKLLPHWRAPEDFAAAVCVPVSTPTVPLGTLWIFSDEVRQFSGEQTNLVEIVAGRLATELEREVLLNQSVRAKRWEGQLLSVAQSVYDLVPRFAPPLDDWQLAGWTSPADGIGHEFYDWNILHDGRLAVALGSTPSASIESAVSVCTLHAATKSHACYPHDAAQMLERVGETLWTGSAGDQQASLAYALFSPETGQLEIASAGKSLGMILRGTKVEKLPADSAPLGTRPEVFAKQSRRKLGAGSSLVLLSEGTRNHLQQLHVEESQIVKLLRKHEKASAQQLVNRLRDLAEGQGAGMLASDCTVLVARRRP